MGEKKQNTNEGGDQKKKSADGAKKEVPKTSVTVLLKIDMHCEGCASKILNCVKAFDGVETVKTEWEANKLTVVGKVDPAKIRDKLAEKTKKKVDLVSPQPNSKDSKTSEKKPKEPQVTTAVLKLSLHCQGCIEKVHRVLSKTKGIQEKCIDRQKDLLTVKGTMDANALAESVKKALKRSVEIVPAKKDKEGGEKKDKEGDGKDKEGGGKKGKGGGGGKEENGAPKTEETKIAAPPSPVDGYEYGYGQVYPYSYSYSYPHNVYAVPDQLLFSDENPNACTLM